MAMRRKQAGRAPEAGVHLNRDNVIALPAARLGSDDPFPPEDHAHPRKPFSLVELYQTHAPRLLRFFARRAERQEARDLLHESFVRLADASERRIAPIDRPEAYLNQIATNLLRSRAKTALSRSLANHVPADEEPLAGQDPVAALEARDELARLEACLLRLSPKTRAIFFAHRLDGMSYKDIARAMGLSVKGVEWHMTKAIAHLDRALRAR